MSHFSRIKTKIKNKPELEEALLIKEWKGDGEVVVVSMGPDRVQKVIREGLAKGADRGIHIEEVGPIEKDPLLIAKRFTAVLKDENFDLIITGRESIDFNGGIVPGMLATYLDMPFVNACIGLELNGNQATVIREIDGGKETLEGNLPMLISGQKGLVEEKDLRIPAMRGIMMARKKPLTVIEAGDAKKQTSVIEFDLPEAKAACTMIEAENVDQLVQLLHSEAKVI